MASSPSFHPYLILLLLLLVLVFSTSTISCQEEEESLLLLHQVGPRRVGGRTEVRDVEKNLEVQELGLFAVEEFNRRRTSGFDDHDQDQEMLLLFSRVLQAQRQVVSGIKYYLVVLAKVQAVHKDDDNGNNGVERVFQAVVLLKPWLHDFKQLLSFKPSQDR